MSGSTALSTARRYEEHIANKVQLLLDATLGLINVELNNIIKVLTIVWVVGIPPTVRAYTNPPETNTSGPGAIRTG